MSTSSFIPPLKAGERLSRDEFERRYEAMPHLNKAELVEGVVYLPEIGAWSQARARAELNGWLSYYGAYTADTKAAANPSVRLDSLNEPQPDGVLIHEAEYGGRTHVAEDDILEGPPELVAEISPYPGGADWETRFGVYRRHKVRECLIWYVQEQSLGWFVLRQDNYDRQTPNAQGHHQSEVFPGLWLDPAALTRFDLATVLQVLQQGLASPEHAAFVAKLQQARKPAT